MNFRRKHTIAILMKIMGEDENPILIFDNKILNQRKRRCNKTESIKNSIYTSICLRLIQIYCLEMIRGIIILQFQK